MLGDPLSPLVFVLIKDGLNNMIQKCAEAGLVEGLLGSRTLKFTNLQYIDDILLFSKNDIAKAISMK